MGCWTKIGCGPAICEGVGAASFCSAGASGWVVSALRNMEPIPGSQRQGTSMADATAPQPSAQNIRFLDGLGPALPLSTITSALPSNAPILPPAPVIPATPPTAVGMTYGTTANVAPSVMLVKAPQKMSDNSRPPSVELSLLRVEKTISATPIIKVCWKRACKRPVMPNLVLYWSLQNPPKLRMQMLRRPKTEPMVEALVCGMSNVSTK
mmetsp:Transcript_49041/g.79062  ORF Transcript_49041/g.79062 Transcript_49041/m.79062 type:complete len:209 (-) Transcript_49041:1166-1792(-)